MSGEDLLRLVVRHHVLYPPHSLLNVVVDAWKRLRIGVQGNWEINEDALPG